MNALATPTRRPTTRQYPHLLSVPAPGQTPAEVSARRVAAEAVRWLDFATGRARMRPETLLDKALASACFSVAAGASGFAVPSKLVGVREHQRRLWTLVREGYDRWERLETCTVTTEGVRVLVGDEVLGEVQPKHVPWVRPLVPFGLTVHLGRVTGHETDGHTLGVNVVFGGVGPAIVALSEALRASGHGDVAAPVVTALAASGDGSRSDLRLVVPALARRKAA